MGVQAVDATLRGSKMKKSGLHILRGIERYFFWVAAVRSKRLFLFYLGTPCLQCVHKLAHTNML